MKRPALLTTLACTALYLAIVSLTVTAARRIEVSMSMHGYGRQAA